MNLTPALTKIRNHLFYGSSNYTKNQPDLFVPHHFQMLSARSVTSFIETIKQSMDETEILLYCHLPFCVSECLFCNSFPMKAEAKAQQGYLQHLLKEIDLFAQSGVFEGKKAKCIYFGGGTPTSYPNSDLDLIITKIKSSIDLSPNCSITSEAHPLTLRSESRIEGLASIGINRISIGCQSFDANVLSHCNRDNAEPLIRQIVKTAQTCGLAINIDMMTGLPGQTISSVRRDLDILSDIHPNAVEYIRHEIVNPLVVELYRKRPDLLVNDDTLFEMVHISQEWMDKRGYEQNGRFSDDTQWGYRYHWLHEMPVIAFGARSRSYTRTLCYDKHDDLSLYSQMIDKGLPPIGRFIPLTKRERMYRTLFLGLQLTRGVADGSFHGYYGEHIPDVFGPLLAELTEYGCIEHHADSVRLTTYGAYFIEDVCDRIIDQLLQADSGTLVRAPHSGGKRYPAPHRA